MDGWPGFTEGDLWETMFSVQGLSGAAHAAGPQPAATKHPQDLLIYSREGHGWMVVQRAQVPDAADPSADTIPSATDEGFVLRAPFSPHFWSGSLGKAEPGTTSPRCCGYRELSLDIASRPVPHLLMPSGH